LAEKVVGEEAERVAEKEAAVEVMLRVDWSLLISEPVEVRAWS
jgi:hypothetical protein